MRCVRFSGVRASGAVRKRQPEEQLDQALCLTILTNAVIYWNTIYMQEAVDRLREKGYAILDEDLAHVAPSQYAHINPHGKMHFEVHDDLVPRPRRPLRDPQVAAVPQVNRPRRRGRPKKQTVTREVMNAETTGNDSG